MWPGGGQKRQEEMEYENRPCNLNIYTEKKKKVKERKVLYKHKCCWLGVCKFDFGKGIQSFKGGKTPKPETQTSCSLPAAMALEKINSKI